MGKDRAGAAFSLIELLVTISIIALLISLLLPALTQAHEAAYTAVCAGNQKQYGMAFFMYSEDRDGVFPWFMDSWPQPNYNLDWINITEEYMGAQAHPAIGSTQVLDTHLATIQKFPTGRAEISVVYGGVNDKSTRPPHAPILYGGVSGQILAPAFKFSEVRDPDSWAILLDGVYFMYTFANWAPNLDWDEDGLPDTYSGLQIWGKTDMHNRGRPRTHQDSLNMTMVDAHVERVDLGTFLDPTADFWHDD